MLLSRYLNNSPHPTLAIDTATFAEMQTLLALLEAESAKSKSEPELMKSYASILVIKYLQCMENTFPDLPGPGSNTFNSFRLLAESQFTQNHQAAFYARQLNMTENQLNKLCLKFTGFSTSDYLKQRILLEAKRLLYNSDQSVKEIAHALGFEDPSYFNRFFRKNTELTPGDFRKEHQLE
jgi:AraC family transcriptional activator of pobA